MNRQEAGKLGMAKTRHIFDERKKQRLSKYAENPTLCACCKEPLPYEKRKQKFCSHVCSATLCNAGVDRYERIRGFKVDNRDKNNRIINNECLNCKAETSNVKFCSEKCSAEYKWNCTKKNIEKNDKQYSQSVYRKYLLEKHGHICKLCCAVEWQGQIVPLVLDHVDGNSDNNNLSNLRMICHNCDALLPTFAGRNKNSARKYRRDTYKRKYC